MRSLILLLLGVFMLSSFAWAAALDINQLQESIEKIENDLYQIDWTKENAQTKEEQLLERLHQLANNVTLGTEDENLALADIFHQGLAPIFREYGIYEWAIEMYQKAIDLRKPVLGKNAELVVRMTKNIATCYNDLELYEQAIDYFDQAAKGYEKGIQNNAFGIQDQNEAQRCLRRLGESYRFLGLSYSQIGEFQQAKRNCNKAITVHQKLDNPQYAAFAYTSLSEVLTLAGNYERARLAAQKAEKIALKTNDQFELANIYNNLGNIYDLEAKYDSAILCFKKALVIDEKMGNTSHSGATFNNIGLVYLHKNKADSAMHFFRKALKTISEIQDNAAFHYDYSATYENMGDLFYQQKNYDEALQNYQLALMNNSTNFRSNNAKDNPNPNQTHFYSKPDFLRILGLKANAFYAQKDVPAAVNTFLLYDQAIDLIHRDLQLEDSRLTWVQRAHAVYENAIAAALETGNIEQAFLFSERSKAVLLLRQLQDLDAKVLLPDSLIRVDNSLKRKIGAANRELFDYSYANDSLNLEKSKAKLMRLEEERSNFRDKLERKFPSYLKQKNSISNADLSEIRQKTLDGRTAMVAYFAGEQHWTVFLLTKNDLKASRIPRDLATTELLSSFIKNLRSDDFQCENYNESYDIYQKFLQKQLESLSRKIQHLVIVPDGQLALLPFEALLREPLPEICANYDLGRMAFLLEKFKVSYAYSANVMLENLKQSRQHYQNDFLGFAPYFSANTVNSLRSCNQGQLGPLQYNDEEIRGAAEGYYTSVSHFGPSGTSSALAEELGGFRIVHFATHACQNGLDTRIFLAQNDVLSGKEIRSLNMKTDMVILSACETGTGTVKTGEGVMSLARDFAIAGAPSLVMSLWAVDDRSTATIMVELHKNLKKGLTKDEALRQAKLHYLQTEAFNREPQFWASFVLVGNPKAIYSNNNWVYLLALTVLLAGMLFLKIIYQTK